MNEIERYNASISLYPFGGKMKTILIVDDDENINNMLFEVLEKEGFHVLRAFSGSEALLVLEQKKPDLVLLDLMLPGVCGEDVLKKIRDIPVIVVSAKIDIENKVNLLLGGAADYVTKPFDIRELVARIKLQLKNAEKLSSSPLMTFEEITLDENSRRVYVSVKEIKLTRTEFSILKILLQNKGSVVAKSVLLDKLSFETPDCVESSLKVHVSNLRKKLREQSEKDYIESVWGIGFKIG